MNKHLFYLKRDGNTIASGFYDEGKFVVLKGSTYNYTKNLSPLMKACPILEEDTVFSSPSSAGVFCLNKRTCNGWKEWRDSEGKTLDSVYRGNEDNKE